MKFLIDNSISPLISNALINMGHKSEHVLDINMAGAKDSQVFDHALANDQIIITADTDFGTISVLQNKKKPSIIIFRKGVTRLPKEQIKLLTLNFPIIKDKLDQGAIVVFYEDRIRIRKL
ncbi:MAG: DUF5615 family PIN-like protein [Bdellovibrionales bacterium]|nr:DUF5615 family PIN-like protein [Bdellovibrionales bacterium]